MELRDIILSFYNFIILIKYSIKIPKKIEIKIKLNLRKINFPINKPNLSITTNPIYHGHYLL